MDDAENEATNEIFMEQNDILKEYKRRSLADRTLKRRLL